VKDTVTYIASEEGKHEKVSEEEPFRLFTCDHFNDNYPNHSQYGAVPILHARSKGLKSMAGLYWCNASDTFVDFIKINEKRHTHWISETGHLQLFIYAGASPSVVFYKQAHLTGFAPIPPNFILGYH
jgi:alpha 1,3-glucosidase